VLYAAALDGSQKFGSLEEQIFVIAQAFKAENSLLLPLFLDPVCPEQGSAIAFKSAGLPIAYLDLFGFRWKTLWELDKLISRHAIQLIHWHFYPPINRYVIALSALRPHLRHYFTDHNSREVPTTHPAGFSSLFKRFFLKRYQRVL